MSANPTSSQKTSAPVTGQEPISHFDGGWLAVLALPWLLIRLDTTWLFGYASSPFGFIDPWVYFGFFFDLTHHIQTFKGAYFTTRITWTVPGAVVYHIFPPLLATYVLHFAVFYAATLSLYVILKITVGGRAALLATLLMGCHSYFLWSVGWPYIDGAANAYLLLTLCALTFAARSPRATLWLMAAGALAAMTVYCQIFLIVFAPVVMGYYHFARKQWDRSPVRSVWKPVTWGFAAVTLIFGLFNMAINGRFLFFINSLGTAAKLVINHNPYKDSTYAWIAQATWLIMPAVMLVGAWVSLKWKGTIDSLPNARFAFFWQRFYILCVATLVFWQLIGQPVLQLFHYTSYLIPSMFLALGSQLQAATGEIKRPTFILLCGGLSLLTLLPFLLSGESRIILTLQAHPFLVSLSLGLIGVVLLTRSPRSVGVVGTILLSASLASVSAVAGPRTWSKAGSVSDPAFQKSAMLAIVDSIRVVKELDPKGNLFFWYDGEGRLGKLYRTVASTYLWSYRLQSEEFPSLGTKKPPLQRRIVILSEDGDTSLRSAQASLAQAGLEGRFLDKRVVHEGPFQWDMVEIEIASETDGQANSH